MPIFLKILLFCSVPAVLLGVLAMPCMRNDHKRRADAWSPLSAAGVSYRTPRGWTVEDPLTTTTQGLDVRWSMDWPERRSTHGATFFPGNGAQVTVFVGKQEKLEALAQDALATYAGNVMIERFPAETWTTKDGVELHVERAHYVPGPLAGSEQTMLLAWGGKGGRFAVVNAGGAGNSLPTAAVRDLLAQLTLGR
jgi:hypothetical protein